MDPIITILSAIGALLIAVGTSAGLLATARKTLTEARVLSRQSQQVSADVAHAAAELTPNHGSSMKDQVTRLESSVQQLVGVVGETRLSVGGIRDDLRLERQALHGHISDSRETHSEIHDRLGRLEAAFAPTPYSASTAGSIIEPPRPKEQ